MFIRYLNDMKSWILLFVLSLGFADLIIWLDKGIPVEAKSVIYINVLLLSVLLIFVIWRYFRETKFMKALRPLIDGVEEDWQEALPEPLSLRDEMTNDVLRQVANDYLKRLYALKATNVIESDYTAAWVHEVKAPLTAMKLVIEANRNETVLRKIETEWLRVHLLIEQQLYISRLPSLESDYVLEKNGIHRLVAGEVRELASWCRQKNIAIEFEGEDREVVTDSKWCRFIIRQVMTNAVKYSPSGATIWITTDVTASSNVSLSIKDEGPGIPSHDLPRLFDKGFTGGTGRLHNAATGLGLYLAKTVADKIGITLTVQSEIGHGTTMQLTFTTENDFDSVLT
ncbi:sensor histidine kinase [Filibacter tadaridae]|uniref:histidine kinase n=1 Tax=Filibacter tadaridae TaxID=2483811 RepID=A0A3P5WT16_9BACL|nr:sensor histidine kinase [Filibacter tadaridae]VDC19104.1 Sensor histidine kinase GraS [Filibacter tadaridae]